jgi:tetratricopeptide (TPR) repeat protein
MGTLLAQMRRPQDAVAHYRTAIEGWPDNADIRLNFATALADVGDIQGALAQLDAASGLRPNDPTAPLIAGKLRLTQALSINPNDRNARNELERVNKLLSTPPSFRT